MSTAPGPDEFASVLDQGVPRRDDGHAVVVVPVTEVNSAKDFYTGICWRILSAPASTRGGRSARNWCPATVRGH